MTNHKHSTVCTAHTHTHTQEGGRAGWNMLDLHCLIAWIRSQLQYKDFFLSSKHHKENVISFQWLQRTIWKKRKREENWATAAWILHRPLERSPIQSKWVLNQGLQHCVASHGTQMKVRPFVFYYVCPWALSALASTLHCAAASAAAAQPEEDAGVWSTSRWWMSCLSENGLT